MSDEEMADLIDTQWNVNQDKFQTHIMAAVDLIDTQWNVNEVDMAIKAYISTDLIDTQWNVNKAKETKLQILTRFNRYIVECKYPE